MLRRKQRTATDINTYFCNLFGVRVLSRSWLDRAMGNDDGDGGCGLVAVYIRAGSSLISKSPLEDFIIWTLYIYIK
jgi:hypothetical protein